MFKCPKCQKELEDMDVPEFYCKYCGTKIVRDVIPPKGRNRKVINLSKENSISSQSNGQILQNNTSTTPNVNVQYVVHNNRINLSLPLIIISSIGFIIFGALIIKLIEGVGIAAIMIGAVGIISSFVLASKVSSDKEEQKLQLIVDQIQADIKNHDYISAKIKADTLHHGGDWSNEVKKKWDTTRELLLKHIDEAEKDSK